MSNQAMTLQASSTNRSTSTISCATCTSTWSRSCAPLAHRISRTEPAQPLARKFLGQAPGLFPICIDQIEPNLSFKGDPPAVRRPGGNGIVHANVGQTPEARAIDIDDPELPGYAVRRSRG